MISSKHQKVNTLDLLCVVSLCLELCNSVPCFFVFTWYVLNWNEKVMLKKRKKRKENALVLLLQPRHTVADHFSLLYTESTAPRQTCHPPSVNINITKLKSQLMHTNSSLFNFVFWLEPLRMHLISDFIIGVQWFSHSLITSILEVLFQLKESLFDISDSRRL